MQYKNKHSSCADGMKQVWPNKQLCLLSSYCRKEGLCFSFFRSLSPLYLNQFLLLQLLYLTHLQCDVRKNLDSGIPDGWDSSLCSNTKCLSAFGPCVFIHNRTTSQGELIPTTLTSSALVPSQSWVSDSYDYYSHTAFYILFSCFELLVDVVTVSLPPLGSELLRVALYLLSGLPGSFEILVQLLSVVCSY